MTYLDLTLDTPAENLACDEALLDLCEEERAEILRFWESRQHFVVVGYGNRIESEVNVEACRARGIPILRRCTGGGTVVQGPGCLSYALTLRIPESGSLTTVTGTNQLVMERNRAVLEDLLGIPVSVQGHTDLAMPSREISWLKFSGNAQRRRRASILFHGTFLCAFDLQIIEAVLCNPSKQPEYREKRGHSDFVVNLAASADSIRRAVRSAWDARECSQPVSPAAVSRLVHEKYGNSAWVARA
jgi:lipoate-protein ligase A